VLNSRSFLTYLHELAGDVDGDLSGVAEHLDELTDTLEQVVPGFAGLQLTVVRFGHPVTLDATRTEPGHRVVSSLRVPLPLLSLEFEPGGQTVFYSAVPGALLDLAADLTHLLVSRAHAGTAGAVVELDVDLPLVPGGPLLTGLGDLITVNQAHGVLIDQGEDPGTADQALRRGAAAAGLTPLVFARRLLDHVSA